MAINETIQRMQRATLSARAASGDNTVGVQLEQGRFRVVRFTYFRQGVSAVAPASEWGTADDAIEFLRRIETNY
jgi:hypothetical protein